MFELFYSNRLEELVDALGLMMVDGHELWYSAGFRTPREALGKIAGNEALSGRRDPFEVEHVVVPNWNIKRHLELELSRRLGVVANLEFHRIRRFLSDCLPEEGEGAEQRVLDRDRLHHVLFEILGDESVTSAAELAPVREYLEPYDADVDADSRIMRRHQLAGRLSKLFVDYAFTRPEMVRAWTEGTIMDEPPTQAAERYRSVERWQRRLWLEVTAAEGYLAGLEISEEERFRTLPAAVDEVPEGQLEVPDRVHFFGLSYVASVYGRILHRLASETEVYFYCLNPCGEFWEDLRTGRDDEEEYLLSSRPVDGGAFGRDDDGFWVPEKENAPLRIWGRPGRDHVRLLGQLVEGQSHEIFRAPLESGTGVLHHIQQDIFVRRPEDVEYVGNVRGQQSLDDAAARRREQRPELDADESLQFLPCSGTRREVEVVAEEIWSLIRDAGGEGERPLNFNEIAVVVNERQKEEYIPQIESVFDRVREIPYNVVDLPAGGASGVLEAVELMLDLPFEEFERDRLLRFLVHPNVAGRFHDVDTDEWIAWCDRVNIIRGADREELSETYLEEDVYNWDQGLKRLILGAFMAADESREEDVFEHEDGAYLPEETSPQRLESVSRLVTLARSLISDVEYLAEAEHSLAGWAEIVDEMVETYVTADERDSSTLLRCRREIRELAELDPSGEAVPYRAAYEFIRERLEGLEIRKGQYLADGVVVSSFLPMRPIPFRYVFVLGMGEDAFPASDPDTPLDLRTARWQPGDVGPRDQDRYMFLETLVSTREGLYLSWVARDPSTGEALEPSAVVRELQYVMSLFGVDPQDCTRRQPLRRYDRETYFDGVFASDGDASVSPRTVDAEAFREAKLEALREEVLRICDSAGVEFPDMEAFESHLDPADRDRLYELLGRVRADRDESEAAGILRGRGEHERLRVRLSDLRRFIESPLQGAARARLRMKEVDERDPLSVEHEPFEVDALMSAIVLRGSFHEAAWSGLRGSSLEEAYDAHTRRAVLRGELPAGLFLEVSRRNHLEMLRTWRGNLETFGISSDRPLRRYRFGRSRSEPAEGRPALLIDVDIPVGDGTETERRTVELHGATRLASPEEQSVVVLNTSSRTKIKYVARGMLSSIVLTAAGLFDEEGPGRVIVNRQSEVRVKKAADEIRDLEPMTRERATSYLRSLIRDLFTDTRGYLMPIEVVEKYVDEEALGRPRRFAELLSKDLGNPYSRSSYQYGPIDEYVDFGVPADVDALIASRFFPLFPELTPHSRRVSGITEGDGG